MPVATGDSGTAVNPAASECGGSKGAQPSAGTSRAKKGDSLTGIDSEAIGSAKLNFRLA